LCRTQFKRVGIDAGMWDAVSVPQIVGRDANVRHLGEDFRHLAQIA
jgi:hypothetical protein